MIDDLPALSLPFQRDRSPWARRWVSLDVWRGIAVLAVISGGWGCNQLAERLPTERVWTLLAEHTHRVAWEGCTPWDFLWPTFPFIAGVALAFASDTRRDTQSYLFLGGRVLGKAAWLVLIGLFLAANQAGSTWFELTQPLLQLGLGYAGVFLLWRQALVTQGMVAISVLVCYGCFFHFYPVAVDFDYAQYSTPTTYEPLEGYRAHWNIHSNAAANFDRWFLNLLPRATPYTHSTSGEQTLNFVATAVTMLLGLMAGEWLLRDSTPQKRLGGLFLAGATGLGIGYALHASGICPVVPRLASPSWVLYSGGWLSTRWVSI